MIAVVLTAPWWDRAATKAGLDLAMTLASFDMPFELFIQGDACGMQRADGGQGHPSKALSSLGLYGKPNWFTDQDGPWIDGACVLSSDDCAQRIRACSQVVRV